MSGVFFVPGFIQAFDEMVAVSKGYKRLVIIQLSGGNDGLNSIIPFRNDIYYSSRPGIAIAKKDQIPINDELGIHLDQWRKTQTVQNQKL